MKPNPNAPTIRYVDVAFNLAGRDSYTYSVPQDMQESLAEGMLVKAPLGSRDEIGCVVATSEHPPELDADRVRPLHEIASPDYRLGGELLALARFIADYYFCTIGEALAAMSVVGFRDMRLTRTPVIQLAEDWIAKAAQLDAPLRANQRAACERLEAEGRPVLPKTALAKAAGCTPATIDKLLAAGLVAEVRPAAPAPAPPNNSFADHHVPTGEQGEALRAVLDAIDRREFRVFLLHGITGSGKTEVYLQAMAHVLHNGGTALCLVPEIALTPQTVARFEDRFRQEIGIFHSQMTRRAKLELYRRIESGEVRIVIGARSAVFAPLPRLGLVVLDEEHDNSYKQGETPRYHARDVAIVRAQRLGIPVVLGSATPSLESYHNALTGKYTLQRLSARAVGIELPPVRVVDLTREAIEGAIPSLFSRPLLEAIRERLRRGEQTILFLNRRGFSNFLFCPSCKWVARCDEDDVALTVHQRRARRDAPPDGELDLFTPSVEPESYFLRCHFCGASHNAPKQCPKCQGESLMTVGAGTQRVERELELLFPDARLLRMDYDTAGGREAFLRAWKKLVDGEADIILGTQMIAKGLHLERVTLVGVVLADIGLFLPDFRAEERSFQLLTQVAGRAGRISAGEVIFQTYMPNHTAIRFATRHDYEGFYAEEERRRRQLAFPPFRRIIAVTLADEDRDRAFKAARLLGYLLSRMRADTRAHGISINGPTVAPIARLAGRFRFRVLLRGATSGALARLLHAVLDGRDWQASSSTRLTIDVDPVDLL